MEEDQILQKTIVHILKTFRVLGCISLGGLESGGRRTQKNSPVYILGILETVSHVLVEKGTRTKHFYVVVNNKLG